MGKAVAEDQVRVEVREIRGVVLRERHHDVGMTALRHDELLRVHLASIELGEHLVGRVAAPRAVALQLPRPPQLLRRRERHAHVVKRPQRLRVEVEQSLDHQELRRAHVHRRLELARLVAVHRLQHRLAAAEVRDVLGEDVEVVRIGVQRGHAQLAPLLAVEAVVVVRRHVRHVRVADHSRQAAREGCLAGARVADHAYDDRPRHLDARTALRGTGEACRGSGARIRRARERGSGRLPSRTARRGPRSARARHPPAACP